MNFGGLLFRVGGDGSLCESRKQADISYNKTERDSAEWDWNVIKILSPKYRGKILEDKSCNRLRINSAALYRLCGYYGWTNKMNKLIVTPQIRNETREFLRNGIGSFYGADGHFNFYYDKNRIKRGIHIQQGDRNLIKLENKRKWLLFIQEILKSVGIESGICYKKPKTEIRKGIIWNNGGSYTLYVLFSKNPKTATIFRDCFPLYNEAKEAILDRMVEFEKEKIKKIEKVKEIRKLYNNGMKAPEIAKKLNMNYYTVWDIVTGRSHANI